MSSLIQAPRGMNDVLPSETRYWQHIESALKNTLFRYDYQEIRTPIVEQTALFSRSVGEATDIVEKEMYTFADRDKTLLSLRPEGTASCVRAGIQRGLLYNQIQRLWYLGPFFRHERPQKGRYRQFYQLGVEAFGIPTPDIDAELIMMSYDCFKKLNLLGHVTLKLSTLGNKISREHFKTELVEYFKEHPDQLDEDSVRRLTTNPLRILDSKNPAMQNLLNKAPKIYDYLDAESKDHFAFIRAQLDAAHIQYQVDPRIVRGLDYYNDIVFEWVTDLLGSQSTVCAGGRYDGLVEQLGGKSTPATGFAIGIERLVELMHESKQLADLSNVNRAYLITQGNASLQNNQLAKYIREMLPESWALTTHCGGGSMKNQMKKADKADADYAFIIGDEELIDGSLSIKPLKNTRSQIKVAMEELPKHINRL